MKPTREYLTHHAVEPPRVDANTFRQGWSVRSRLDALLRDGKLTPGEWQAAVEYRAAWERAHQSAGATLRLLRGPGGGGGDAHGKLLGLVGSVARLQVVETAIGGQATDLVRACVVRDAPWAETARRLRRDPHTAREWTALAISALARAWEASTRREGGVAARVGAAKR